MMVDPICPNICIEPEIKPAFFPPISVATAHEIGKVKSLKARPSDNKIIQDVLLVDNEHNIKQMPAMYKPVIQTALRAHLSPFFLPNNHLKSLLQSILLHQK